MTDEATLAQTRLRLIRLHKEEQDRRMLEWRRSFSDPSLRRVPKVKDFPEIARPHKVKRGVNNVPRIALFKKGDLVQPTALYLRRQRVTGLKRKTEDTKGVYYGPAKGGRYVYVDWYTAHPWEHMERQVVQVDYIEPLGTPR